MGGTGLRIGEALAIRTDDFDPLCRSLQCGEGVADARASAENLKRDSPSGYSGVIGTSSMPLHKRKKGAPVAAVAASPVASRTLLGYA